MTKYIVLCLALLCLNACSDRTKSFQGIQHPESRPVYHLKGQTRTQIHQSFGKPIATRVEEGQALWTYRKGTCSTLIYFDKKGIVRHAETRGECKQGITQDEK